MGNNMSPRVVYQPVAPSDDEPSPPVDDPDSGWRHKFTEAIDKAEPALRVVMLVTGVLGIIFCPTAYAVSSSRLVFTIVALAPLLLSAVLSILLFLCRRGQKHKGAPTKRITVVLTAAADLTLAIFHLVMVFGIYISVAQHMRWYAPEANILAFWVSVLVIVDYFIHDVLFLNALMKYFGWERAETQHVCPRCNYSGSTADGEAIAAAVAQTMRDLENRSKKGGYSLLGNYVDESDFSNQPSARQSEDTI